MGTDSTEPDTPLAGRVLGRLLALAPSVVAVSELGSRQYGLSHARGRVVDVLAESGPMVMRALGQALGISPRTVTEHVDALEADGWVLRRPHPTDRRATLIELTPHGRDTYTTLRQGYQFFAATLLSDIDQHDLRRVLAVLDQIEQRLDQAMQKSQTNLDQILPTTANPDR